VTDSFDIQRSNNIFLDQEIELTIYGGFVGRGAIDLFELTNNFGSRDWFFDVMKNTDDTKTDFGVATMEGSKYF
jgi:hypothetical protein